MAASAYAALASLSHVLEQIQHPARHRLCFDRSQIETLHDTVRFLLEFFEDHSKYVSEVLEEVMRFMANVINEAENVIDAYVVDQLTCERSPDKAAEMSPSSFCEFIDRVIQKIKPFKEKAARYKEKQRRRQDQQHTFSLPAVAGSSAPPAPGGKNTMLGFSDHMDRIKDRLTGVESSLQIVPIVGMGGIGKTTLAQNIFHDSRFKNHFDIRMWCTISQEYSVLDILVGLLEEKESSSQSVAELGQTLWKRLFGRRYLIILDDVWSGNVWDDLKLFFPDNRKGSRIIVTTRLSSISNSLSNENTYLVDLLDYEKSWELLCQKAFVKVPCPDPKFEEIGRRIANNCKGLPLSIVVIGGLLSKLNVTLEKWEEVAKNANSIVNSEDDELCLNILSLSYNHLPINLKPCFLYMRVYPEDYNVRVSQLIQSWIAEGFVISKEGKTLEEVAQEYLKDLIDRNLIFTDYDFNHNGEMKKVVGIHDVLRDLCIRENRREHTFRIAKVFAGELMQEGKEYFGKRNICSLCVEREVCMRICFPLLSHSGDTDLEIITFIPLGYTYFGIYEL